MWIKNIFLVNHNLTDGETYQFKCVRLKWHPFKSLVSGRMLITAIFSISRVTSVMFLHKSCLCQMPGSLQPWLMWSESPQRTICAPFPPSSTKLLSEVGTENLYRMLASFHQSRSAPKFSPAKFTFRSWWSYWFSVDINYMDTTIDEASFSLHLTVCVIAPGFLDVIFLKVNFSPPSIFSDMKLVRTNLDISLCSCIIQFPGSIKKTDKEKTICH